MQVSDYLTDHWVARCFNCSNLVFSWAKEVPNNFIDKYDMYWVEECSYCHGNKLEITHDTKFYAIGRVSEGWKMRCSMDRERFETDLSFIFYYTFRYEKKF